ncbi:MAG: hypothetical protein KJP00_04265, partial [Bacteroidia bacterium]|nr:hypothetical protein [Bacteroidia bacterium]
MKIAYFILLMPILLIRVCPQEPLEGKISLMELDPVVLETKGQEIYQYWQLDNQDYLWQSSIDNVSALEAYRDTLLTVLGEKALQSAVLAKSDLKTTNQAHLDTLMDDFKNAELVLHGIIGEIQPIRYLEAEILNYQLNRYPLFSHPTEFHGFIATHDALNLVRIYFASSDQRWPPKPGIVIPELRKALNEGWKL